ncbi:Transglutaminase-like superfamily protein [Pustulibacterium marinum]|uniref:Transglutaminase-like superfamily protein n=1 Tax=Pustulibacterium marinum TaxID=1224947 RepID=A0A1I7GMX0_9FLAO|nr:transglutaminase domain-containing protein [Pustulibacterium marinum]SFU49774.1 Transglutaminase-like superfamily protein [Pustulibacterium marinum]
MKKLSLFIFLLTATTLFAQEYDFGKVTKEELEEKEYESDPDAHAAILQNHRETYLVSGVDDWKIVTEIYKKIKIYDKDGFDFATEAVDLYKNAGTRETIRKIKAVTYNLENGKVVESKLDKDQIFETNLAYSYFETKFTLPNVKAGSVIEISYEINSPFYTNFEDVIYQYDVPVKKFYTEVRVLKGMHYKQSGKGEGFSLLQTSHETKVDHRLGQDVDVYRFTGENIPALKQESYVDNIDNYRGGIVFELDYIQIGTYFRSYSQTWTDVAQRIGSQTDYKDDLDKARFVDDLVDPIIAGTTDPVEKMNKIFNYVKKEFTWNELDGKYFYNGLKKTVKEKKGNSGDINLLLIVMLRYAGIDANPVVISTKDNMVPLFPTLDRLNYVIAHAQIGEEEFLMDATREFSEVNVLPVNDYNWQGIYINNTKLRWKKIPLRQPEQSFVSADLMFTLSEDGSAEGKMRKIYDKHHAMNFRKAFKDVKLDDYLMEMESDYGGIEISDYKPVNTDASNKKAMESFSFFYDEAAEEIGGKLYMEPLVFLSRTESPFLAETREYPIDFGFPYESKKNVIVTIPEGYVVEHLPQSSKMELPDGIGEVVYLASKTPTGFRISYDLKINYAMVSQPYYIHLKDFFSKMVEIESEKIILSKA